MYVDVEQLIGKPPSAHDLAQYLTTLSAASGATLDGPEIKSYPDVVYFNYLGLGVSLQFAPRDGYKPTTGLRREQLRDDELRLEAIDMYNVRSVQSVEGVFCTYGRLPVELHLAGASGTVITVGRETVGREFVGWLGEPSRKGGGKGPSSGSIHIWCEWSQYGIMVEFGGNDARGPSAWERGGDAVWRVLTVFVPPTTC